MSDIYNFPWFDFIIIGLIIFLGLKGLVIGFVKEIFGIIGLIGGVVIAIRFGGHVGAWIDANIYNISNQAVQFSAGFLITLLLFWIVCSFLGFIFDKLVHTSGLGPINRIFGFIFGALKIFLVFSIIIAIIPKINFLHAKVDNMTQNSMIYPYLKGTGDWIMNIDSRKVDQNVDNKANDKRELNEQ